MSRSASSIQQRLAAPGLGHAPEQGKGPPQALPLPLVLRLQRMRRLGQGRVVPELIMLLKELPDTEFPGPARFTLLRKLERAVVRVGNALTRTGAATGTPGGDRPAGLSLEQRLYGAMARASVHLLHELDRGQGFFSEQHAAGRAWAIRAALRFFGHDLLHTIATGRPWSPGAWQALHDLFVYLVMRGTVQIHGESLVTGDAEIDPELAYKRLIMVGLAADLSGDRRIGRGLVAHLWRLAAESRLVASDGLRGEFGLIRVDVGRDAPAEFNAGCLDHPFRGWVLRVPEEFTELLRGLKRRHDPPIAVVR